MHLGPCPFQLLLLPLHQQHPPSRNRLLVAVAARADQWRQHRERVVAVEVGRSGLRGCQSMSMTPNSLLLRLQQL